MLLNLNHWSKDEPVFAAKSHQNLEVNIAIAKAYIPPADYAEIMRLLDLEQQVIAERKQLLERVKAGFVETTKDLSEHQIIESVKATHPELFI